MQEKSGLISGLVNMILPGSCHLYLNDKRWGMAILTFILAPILFVMLAGLALFANSFLVRMQGVPEWLPGLILVLAPLFYLFSFFNDGRYWAKKYNRELLNK